MSCILDAATVVARLSNSASKLFIVDDRGVLAAEFDERLELVTCEKRFVSQAAKE